MRVILPLAATLALLLAGCGGAEPTDQATSDDSTQQPADDTDEPTEPTETTDTDAEDGDDEPTEEDDTDEVADDEPTDDGTEDVAAEGDCSAFGLDDTVQGREELSEEARATAAFLLDAAVRCDEQLLFTAAEESDTNFFFDSATADEVFALPEDPDADPSAWEALARLLGGTTPVGDADIWTWPAAAATGADDAAWQELVDSGLYTQSQVDELRTAGEGYLGWRVGIDTDGTWLFLTAGD